MQESKNANIKKSIDFQHRNHPTNKLLFWHLWCKKNTSDRWGGETKTRQQEYTACLKQGIGFQYPAKYSLPAATYQQQATAYLLDVEECFRSLKIKTPNIQVTKPFKDYKIPLVKTYMPHCPSCGRINYLCWPYLKLDDPRV